MKIIPIFLFVLLYIACRPTAKVSQPQPKPKTADIVGTYVDKFGRTLKLVSQLGLRFEYYCPNLYLGYYEDAEDSSDFCSPCVPTTGAWSFNYDKPNEEILLSTHTYSNLGSYSNMTARRRTFTQNGMIFRQSNKLQDSFIIQVELSQDLPQRGSLWVQIATRGNQEEKIPLPKIDSLPYLIDFDEMDDLYYNFSFRVAYLEYITAHKFRFALPKISPTHVLDDIRVDYSTDYPVNFRHINLNNEDNPTDSLYFSIQKLEYELPHTNSIHEVEILMYPTHAANWRETPFRLDAAGNIIGPYPSLYEPYCESDTVVCIHAPYETIYYRQK